MATVEVPEGHIVVKESELNALIALKDELLEKNRRQTVLITKTTKTINGVQKMFPGLAGGSFNMSGIADLITGKSKLSPDLQNDFKELIPLLEEYQKTNPIPLSKP